MSVFSRGSAYDRFYRVIMRLGTRIEQLEERIATMATQADVDQLTTTIGQVATDLGAAHTTLQKEIDDLAFANPQLNLTGLQAAVAPLDGAVQQLEQLKPDTPGGTPSAPGQSPPIL